MARSPAGNHEPARGRVKTVIQYARRVLPYLRPHWRLAAVVVAVIFLLTAVGLLAPWPLKILVDSVLGSHPLPSFLTPFLGSWVHHPASVLAFAVLSGLGLTLLSNALHVLNSYVHTGLEQRMILDFRSDLFAHTQRLSLIFHDQRRTGELISRINMQSGALGSVVLMIPKLLGNVLTLAGMFWIARSLNPRLALLSLAVVPFIYYSIGYYAGHIMTRVQRVRGMEEDSLSIVHEAMAMIRVIVAFGREEHEFQRFRGQGERAVKARVRLTVRQTVFSLVINTITAAGSALVLWVGASAVAKGQLTVGELLIVMSYISSIYSPLEAISGTVSSLQEQAIGLKMAFELLDSEPEVKEDPKAVELRAPRGRVTFEGVCFGYPRRPPALQDISFEIPGGEVIAVVGATGAGKTTLVSLLPRFYDPQAGRILLDGTDLRKLTLRSLRQQISMVLQEPLLFAGTIRDNIRYGRLDAGKDEIIAAAKAANAHDFIIALPKQYETRLGERGAALSGGERQRISIARAFIKKAPILILDEPTSSIDSRTEGVILDALDRLMVGRTTFLIAHRLSTIRSAGRIIVLDKSRLVEQGTREELLLRNGLYRSLHDAQAAKGRPRVTSPKGASSTEVLAE